MSRTGGNPKQPAPEGAAAAAVAELNGSLPALMEILPSWKNGVTLKAIEEYEELYATPAPFPAQRGWTLVQNVETDYKRISGRLADVVKAGVIVTNGPQGATSFTFTGSGKAGDVTALAQGQAGDCAFLATTIGLLNATADPTGPFISVGPAPKGSNFDYQVKFQGYQYAIEVAKPTQAQIAAYANAGSNGLWLSIVEKAYIKYRVATRDRGGDVTYFGAFFSPDSYSLLDGQTLKNAMKAVTGRAPAAVISRKNAANAVLPADQVAAQLKALVGGAADKDGFQALQVVATAGTPGKTNYVPAKTDLIPGHAYAIVGYNAKTQTLKITNPWNDASYTYGTTFTMSLKDFCAMFGTLCVESRVGVNAKK